MPELTDRDDELHLPVGDDPSWAETAWFAAAIPDRGMVVWLYPLFRTSLGVLSCSVWVWAPGGTELWRQPYFRQYWHQPIPRDFSLTDFTLGTGLSYRCAEPLRKYHLRYADASDPAALNLDLTWEAVQPPQPLGITDGHGHLDQLGRVRGEVILAGERIAVDCLEMRDRTWSPRREGREGTRLGYSYGARDGDDGVTGFHCTVRLARDGSEVFMAGFRMTGGETARLAGGHREVTRDGDGRPVAVTVTGTDAAGASFEVRGEVVSQLALHTSPYFVWVSLVRWQLPDGSAAWGEDQDTWSPGLFRRLRAAVPAR
jgi:hypothetical protein